MEIIFTIVRKLITLKTRMAGRQSKRLRLETPEILQTTFQCFICHGTSYTCDMGTIQLACCKNFVHQRCQARWQAEGRNCGMCRGSLTTDVVLNAGESNPIQSEDIDIPTDSLNFDEITHEVLTMSREQVIARLRELLQSEELEEQLQRVSIFFFFIPIKKSGSRKK